MLLTKPDVTVEGSLQGERHQMRLDENSLVHIMSVLTNLYSDSELAVIREISVNARDSNNEAGNPAPIEVFTPTALSPNFRVKDQGLGANKDDIINIWSLYGASTKRESNTQVGMLGLGSKSPLTYTNQFFVIGIKDGIKTHVSVAKDEDGTSTMEIVDERPTDEPNGVEVVVPVQRHNDFASKAQTFFKVWETGTVKLNGVILERGLKRFADGIYESYDDQDYIVMGGIAYPTEEPLMRTTSNYYGYGRSKRSFIAYVGIGEVAFVPSREALHYTAQTKATIKEITDKIEQVVIDFLGKEIDKAPDHYTAMLTYNKYERDYSSYALTVPSTYKGLGIPTSCRVTVDYQQWRAGQGKEAFKYEQKEMSFNGTYNTDPQVGIVLGHDKGHLTSWDVRKLKHFCNSKGVRTELLFCATDPTSVWLDAIPRYQWIDIKSIKLPPNNVASGRARYRALDESGYIEDVDVADLADEGFYMSIKEFKSMNHWQLRKAFPDVQIVVIYAADAKSFPKKFPAARHYKEMIRDAWKDVEYPKKFESAEASFISAVRRAGLTVNDPEIAQAIIDWKLDNPQSVGYTRYRDIAINHGLYVEPKIISLGITKRYPLFACYRGGGSINDFVDYINLLHQSKENSNAV